MSINWDKVEKVKSILKVSKHNLGKGGEFIVAGNLLMNGFEVFLNGVDRGIDIIAKKKNTFYYVQVKTCQDYSYDEGEYVFSVNLTTLLNYPTRKTFLTLVIHFLHPNRSVDYIGDHTKYSHEIITIPVVDLLKFTEKTSGKIILKLYYLNHTRNAGNLATLAHNKKKLVLDEYLFNSFWQIAV